VLRSQEKWALDQSEEKAAESLTPSLVMTFRPVERERRVSMLIVETVQVAGYAEQTYRARKVILTTQLRVEGRIACENDDLGGEAMSREPIEGNTNTE